MTYTDRSLTCVQCGSEFVFSGEDQQYHADRGYQDPKRCPSCRGFSNGELRRGAWAPGWVWLPARAVAG